MQKLIILLVFLLLVGVVGCSSGDTVTGPDTSDQVQTYDDVQKPANPGDPTDGTNRPETAGDPTDTVGRP